MTPKPDTKQKILEAAAQLFSEAGYDGTSIRDIAKVAEVNIAAINYHFENKENLYHKVISSCHEQFYLMIEAIHSEKDWSTVDFAEQLFHTICEGGSVFVANFKMFLSEKSYQKIEIPHNEKVGPPGGELLLECISREVSKNVSEEDKLWAVRTIFSQVAYFALLVNTSYAKREAVKDFINEEYMADYIRRTTDVLLKSLRN